MRQTAALVLICALIAGCTATPPTPPSEPTPFHFPLAPEQSTSTASPTRTPTPRPAVPSNPAANDTPAAPSPNGTASSNATPPSPPPVWDQPDSAEIYPGIGFDTEHRSCTTNFLFTSLDNRHIYLGSAAHCFAEIGGECEERSGILEPGSPVHFLGPDFTYGLSFIEPGNPYLGINGTLAYNSWYTMRQAGEAADSVACKLNDFALIEIPLAAQGSITPSFRSFGPARYIVQPGNLTPLLPIIAYGHSIYWFNQEPLHQAQGYVTTPPPPEWEYWEFGALFVAPRIPGDSGSAAMTKDGGAAGILVHAGGPTTVPGTTVGIAGPSTNGAVTLSAALGYMEAHTDLRVRLAQP